MFFCAYNFILGLKVPKLRRQNHIFWNPNTFSLCSLYNDHNHDDYHDGADDDDGDNDDDPDGDHDDHHDDDHGGDHDGGDDGDHDDGDADIRLLADC